MTEYYPGDTVLVRGISQEQPTKSWIEFVIIRNTRHENTAFTAFKRGRILLLEKSLQTEMEIDSLAVAIWSKKIK
jgi:hypothetical protein